MCLLIPDHEGPHICSCNGSWEIDPEKGIRIWRWPDDVDLGLPLPGPWQKL